MFPRRLFCTSQSEFTSGRKKFRQLEELYSAVVDKSRLTAKEVVIVEAHSAAVKRYHFTYKDPESGEKIYTRFYHFVQGRCCGEACRHCTYNLESVEPGIKKMKTFNSSFWRDGPEFVDHKKIMKIRDLIKVKPRGETPPSRAT